MAKKQRKKNRSGVSTRKRDQQSSQSPQPAKPQTTMLSKSYRLIAALAALGFVLTAYLTFTKWFGDQPAFCTEDSACDLVQSSRWSTLFGLPLAFWGMAFYASLGVAIWRIRASGKGWSQAWTIACFGFVLSLYLTAISVIEIEATCPYCLASAAIVSVIFVWLTLARAPQLPSFAWPNAAIMRFGVSLFLVALFHFHHAGVFDERSGPEKPEMVALIEHLKEIDAVFYGAYWCPRCQDQKKLFGASVKKIPYVECAPNGRDGLRAAVCEAKRIQSYPTWIINDRPYTGLMSLKELAAISRYTGELP